MAVYLPYTNSQTMKFFAFFKQVSIQKLQFLSASPILIYLLSMKTMLIVLFSIIIIDMFTGIRKSLFKKDLPRSVFKKYFWLNLSSSGMRSTWRKTYEYGIGIIIFLMLDLYILKLGAFEVLNSKKTLTELVISVACLIETWSIFENMEAISNRNLLKRHD